MKANISPKKKAWTHVTTTVHIINEANNDTVRLKQN